MVIFESSFKPKYQREYGIEFARDGSPRYRRVPQTQTNEASKGNDCIQFQNRGTQTNTFKQPSIM